MTKKLFALTAIIINFVLLQGCINSTTDTFKQTQAGSALYSCVSGSGNLSITNLNTTEHEKAVSATISKPRNKTIELQFSINPKIDQAKLIGASVEGESKLTKLMLMLNLEAMCGAEISSKILPDEYQNLRTLQRFLK